MAARHGELVQATVNYLTVLGHHAFVVPNRGVKVRARDGSEKWIRGRLTAGAADVVACHAHGRFIACEIKVRDKRGKMDVMSVAQERFKLHVELRGGSFYEVRDTVQVLIDAHARGEI